eukprot:TRINITY_DN63780_c0_g1_i1.p1 TRINITY_DN63780_c0_g1~~TRINITY_DN63780_c0_g1_i1.p1  ORF type:complete len:514 (+),score=119.89 TRINITY_DN63780_c0_g1_i1:50-1543(+)
MAPKAKKKKKVKKVEEEPKRDDPKIAQVKQIFAQFDRNGDGVISRNELALILARVGKFDGNEISEVMDNVDKNDDGEIQYEEFLDWVLGGDLLNELAKSPFELKQVLRPLFNAFDVDHSGQLSHDEFREVHKVLSGAMAEVETHNIAKLVSSNEPDIWCAANQDGDDTIDFDEFVDWFRECIDGSGVQKDDLIHITQHLATLITSVFAMANRSKRLSVQSKRDPVLANLLHQIAVDADKLFHVHRTEEGLCPTDGLCATALWKLPNTLPEAMDLTALFAEHAKKHPVDNTATVHVQACLRSTKQRWIARVFHYNTRLDAHGHRGHKDFFYAYEQEPAPGWTPLEDGIEFFETMLHLPQEFKLYSLLLGAGKLRASAPDAMTWDQVQRALQEAIELGFFTLEKLMEYNYYSEKTLSIELAKARAKARMNQFDVARVDVLAEKEKAQERLRTAQEEYVQGEADDLEQTRQALKGRTFSPSQVMHQLMQNGIIGKHPLWS